MEEDHICIISSSCRLPFSVLRPEDAWGLFTASQDTQQGRGGTLPPDSRGFSKFRSAGTGASGGWLGEEGVELFDPSFFNIPLSEAPTLRPNVQLGLELTYEALQDSGIPPSTLRGKNVSVSIGLGTEDGWDMTRWLVNGSEAFNSDWAASSDPSGVSGRISHAFDFRGPSNITSNACASGATALRDGASKLIKSITNIKGVASTAHRSASFSDQADGYSPSEGAVFFILKKRSAALAAGDPIWAIVRAISTGHNGATRTLITPNVEAQVDVTLKALNIAKLQPQDISVLEAHGTGTRVGDALEAEGILSVFGQRHGALLILSSSKTVVGHCHGAAALVGILKVLGCFSKRQVPPHQVQPLPQFRSGNVIIPTETVTLPSSRIFAQVNAFGFTGSVSTIILEGTASYRHTKVTGDLDEPRRWLLPFSAKSRTSLLLQVQVVSRWALRTRSTLYDVSTILGLCRDHFLEFRHALIISSIEELGLFLHDGLSYEQLSKVATPSNIPADPRVGPDLLNVIPQLSCGSDQFDTGLAHLIEGRRYIKAAQILYNQGHTLSFDSTYSKADINLDTLSTFPLYQFERQKYWKDVGAVPLQKTLRKIDSTHPRLSPGRADNPFLIDQVAFTQLIRTYGAKISFDQTLKIGPDPEMRSYLLTGANGMLGSRLLARFLSARNITVYCIIRGDPNVRIRSAFKKFGHRLQDFDNALSDGRLHVMQTSDLCSPMLGLNPEDYAVLKDNVDHIIHLAWPVNFNLPFEDFLPFLSCSRTLAELACSAKRLVRLHFIGSYASSFNYPSASVPENELAVRVSDSLSQGYAVAKLVAEHSLIAIHKRDPTAFLLSIVRVGQVCSDTTTGFWNQDELMPMIIASTPILKALPSTFPPVAWIPSDVCASSLFEISTSPPKNVPNLHIVHLANPSVTPWLDVANVIGKIALQGTLPDLIAFPEYVARIKECPQPVPVQRLLPYFENLARTVPECFAVLQVEQSKRYSDSLVTCPPIAGGLLEFIVRQVLQDGAALSFMQSSAHLEQNPGNALPIFLFGPSSPSDDLVFSGEAHRRIMSLAEKSCRELGNSLSISGSVLEQQLRTLASQLSIVEKLVTQGIRPRAVLGYCFGEYAAAISCGILSEASAVELLVRWSAAVGDLNGAMLNVFSDVKTVRSILACLPSPASIAIFAGPTHLVISGSFSDIQEANTQFQRRHIKTMLVKTAIPFHSVLMEKAISGFAARAVAVGEPGPITYISGITAFPVVKRGLGVNYWLRYMREPVKFCEAMAYCHKAFPSHPFIDIGPGLTLSKIIQRYEWHDIEVRSPDEARYILGGWPGGDTPKESGGQVVAASPLDKSSEPGPSTIDTPASNLGQTALQLLNELYGYEISKTHLTQSLQSLGLQSFDFIRFSEYYGAQTGIYLPLSAYVADAPLEVMIMKASNPTSSYTSHVAWR